MADDTGFHKWVASVTYGSAQNLLICFRTSVRIRRKWPREMFGGDCINKTHESQQQPERWSEVKGRGVEKTLADFGGILYIIPLDTSGVVAQFG